jgi:hypothetical protein
MDRDLRIGAYVDDELGADERRRFEAEMAGDPDLARQVERQTQLRARLSAAFDPVLAEAVPPSLERAARLPARPRSGLSWDWRMAGAIAACLVVGVLIGRETLPRGPLQAQDGALVARGTLARTLDGALAADAGPIRVGLSFKAADGGFCRTFQSREDRLAGLACRKDGRWVAETLTAWRPQDAEGYRTASSDTPPEVLAAVDRLIAGDPLDAEGERRARSQGWK